MIINRIILNNLGPFIGLNKIDTNYSDENFITLIGGKNGAGKTTLFNSIRIGLYGCKTFGYEVNNQNYYHNISKLINDKELLKDDYDAFVEIEIEFNDGQHDGVYSIKRSWDNYRGNIYEKKEYKCDDKILNEEQSFDFENLLMHLMPPSLFNFYFFDGEKISEILSDDGQSTNFKDAFVKICGLDNLEYLIECFEDNSEKASKNQKVINAYKEAKEIFETNKNIIDKLDASIFELNSIVMLKNSEIKNLRKGYQKIGGASPKEWKELNTQISEEEAKREQWRKELKDFANNSLPFIILKEELLKLKCSLEESEGQINLENALRFIEIPSAWNYISSVLNPNITKEAFINSLKSVCTTNGKTAHIELSKNDFMRVITQIEDKLSLDVNYYIDLEASIIDSLKKVKQLRDKLASMNIESYDLFRNKEIALQKELDDANKEIVLLQAKRFEAEFNLNQSLSIYEKAKKEYENDIKKLSIHDISSRAYLSFKKLSLSIYSDYINEIKTNFIEIFNCLINKQNLIHGIHIDRDLSVYPYRNVEISSLDAEKMYKELGKDGFIKKYGELAYLSFKNNNRKKFLMPMKIKGTLSEGENQVYLMSLYLSLALLSTNPMPFIIDTPFGRIDNEHRNNLLRNFFLKLKGQLVILSTDEEINSTTIGEIKDYIGSMMVFKNNGNGKTDILTNQYFGGIKK